MRTGCRAWRCLIAIAIGLVLSACSTASAQSIFAHLSGSVTDTSGAVVAGAKITVTNSATRITQQLTTNKDGYFSVGQLAIGTYDVSVQAKGFEKWNGTGIVLNASDVKDLSIPLRVGAETQTVEVSATADQIDITESGAKAETISAEDLEKQPLIGRNATEILRIIPGAAQITLNGTNRPAADGEMIGVNGFTVNGNAGGMAGVSINGQSGTGLSINQDGQNVEDPGAPGGATPVNPNPDMISEIQVLTSNYGADNAKGPVVINTVSKSGGSRFHGDFHFFARNSVLNAEEADSRAQEVQNNFKPGYLKVPSQYYYPGFTVGGPVIIPHTGLNGKGRNRFFFHEAFEDYRQLIDGGINDAFVPTADMITTGDFSALGTADYLSKNDGGWAQPYWSINGRYGVLGVPQSPTDQAFLAERPGCSINNGVMTKACIDPSAQLWLQHSLPAANLSVPNSAGWNYVKTVQEPQNDAHNMAKLDMNFGENTKAYITWSRQRENATEPLGLWQGSGDWVVPGPSPDLSKNTSDLYTFNMLHVFSPSLTVEGRVGYTHMDMPGSPQIKANVLRSDMNFPLKGVFNNPNAPIATSWSGSIPNIGDIGHDYHPNFYAEKGIPSAGADLTKVFRTHTAKFGFLWENIYNAQDAWAQYQGVFSYGIWSRFFTGNNYADILMGANQGYYEQALPPVVHMQQAATSFYATDHWKLNRRITLDYGLRFEHYAAPYADNRYGGAVFDPSKYNADLLAGKQDPGVSWHSLNSSTPLSGSTQQYLVYSPRVGASIDVYGNGKTVVRGGWGMYRYETNLQDNHLGAANTALGSVGWGAPGAAATWEDIDLFQSTGASGSCAAAQTGGIDSGKSSDCAPAIAFGVPTNMANSSISVLDSRDKDQPYTVTYSLNIDQEFPRKFMAEMSYVGNYSALGQVGVNFNAVPVGAMTDATVAAKCSDLDTSATNPNSTRLSDAQCQQRFRPYPYYQGINANESGGLSQYDSLQAKLTRSSQWATFNLNYAWSKNMGDPTSSGAFSDWGKHEYWTVLNYNRAHVFNASYVFTTPTKRFGNRFLSGAVNGYQFSGITQVQSGAMLSAVSGYYLNLQNGPNAVYSIGSPDVTVAPVLTCDPALGLKKNQFANPNCFAFPTQGTGIGNTRMPALHGPLYWTSDAAAEKDFAMTEHQRLEFRFTAKNFMNHDLLSFRASDPNLTLNFSNGGSGAPPLGTLQNASTFGFATAHYGHRLLELSAKYTF
jgi:hypothetical protein